MASGFFALLDDVTTLLDDVAAMSKLAAKKTAGILGDDLAVNAEKASGYAASREIPVLIKITKGSLLNKLIILPFAFILSALYPPAVNYILMIGGLYLAFEGAEKIYEFLIGKHQSHHSEKVREMSMDDLEAYEDLRVKSAIRVDFILSIEIIIIALSAVADQDLTSQIVAVSVVALLATIGVYGLVALIVRLDDLGYKLIKLKPQNSLNQKIGNFLINALPYIIRALSVIGTLAMVLVAGGIYLHHVPFLHHLFASWPSILAEFVIGLVIGLLVLLIEKLILKFFKKKAT